MSKLDVTITDQSHEQDREQALAFTLAVRYVVVKLEPLDQERLTSVFGESLNDSS